MRRKDGEKTNSEIHKINLNSKEGKKIVDVNGYTTYINIIDNWIFYTDVNSEGNNEMFRIKTNGTEKQNLSL